MGPHRAAALLPARPPADKGAAAAPPPDPAGPRTGSFRLSGHSASSPTALGPHRGGRRRNIHYLSPTLAKKAKGSPVWISNSIVTQRDQGSDRPRVLGTGLLTPLRPVGLV
ncbi:hypothetical protein HGM15179_000241 [Zosterops borbonicus]|uniref:Uncharacterized protein n=1 Tax=Zosterops borbonicus TaxID=364589 RepID=A0A8K1LUT7_9PASS|nr:hypothetical protein HGM15179_000241 [Zosterops borbonicus]